MQSGPNWRLSCGIGVANAIKSDTRVMSIGAIAHRRRRKPRIGLEPIVVPVGCLRAPDWRYKRTRTDNERGKMP